MGEIPTVSKPLIKESPGRKYLKKRIGCVETSDFSLDLSRNRCTAVLSAGANTEEADRTRACAALHGCELRPRLV